MKKNILRSSIIILFLFSFIFRNNIFNLISYLNYVFTFDNSYSENEILRIENINLKKELKDLLLINDIKYDGLNIINAKIITNNLYNNKTVTINKGKNYNLKSDLLVINKNGLIGVITKVYKNYSTVSLLDNINISVKINDRYYILKYEKELYVDNLDNINKFDMAYTSGISSYPEGVIIGYVYNIVDNKALIKSKVDFESLNYVSIIMV